ncbi:phosphomannomutase [Aliivibrio sp. S2TY2]|uniref:phosphomannomutase n=1 Tax=unclassified Aliivibrio TaxID=2645654 RepID=UPI002378B96B|nr:MULTISPECIES: phosphomannomutase [unclassified Aliivibrio]MDD9174889.1 phosphomannomutase [Aliivibrio sp. S3TY1]MDD9192164.1 phosphomannomutase [Aliivibrio sp. S2TY2]
MLISSEVIRKSNIQFGTSGARGLVEQFTADTCAAFTYAFIKCMQGKFRFENVALAIDNRPSSPVMAQACIKALEQLGLEADYYGVIPTPALAYVAMQDNIPCIMITGSHIPFDRNGLKFYRPDGEISKADEQAILNTDASFTAINELPELVVSERAATEYISRYTGLFDASSLSGKRIGIYEHSSAGRDLYAPLFTSLGAEVVSLERSDEFVPIDTEAVAESDKLKALDWSKQYQLDAIFSTDGDGDRPLLADEGGKWLRGDILGLLCSRAMNIEALSIPISCNTVIETLEAFKHVERTKIGSPYVIAEFSSLVKIYDSVAGFEANGGYLLGSDIEVNGKTLKALPTRDAVLPALMLLVASGNAGISQLVEALPRRVTDSGRIQNFATEKSLKILADGQANPELLMAKLGFENAVIKNVDITDGLRLTCDNEDVIHLRPSGNAPELRCYIESTTTALAKYYLDNTLAKIQLI